MWIRSLLFILLIGLVAPQSGQNACRGHACKNKATCQPLPRTFGRPYRCVCKPDYVGRYCDVHFPVVGSRVTKAPSGGKPGVVPTQPSQTQGGRLLFTCTWEKGSSCNLQSVQDPKYAVKIGKGPQFPDRGPIFDHTVGTTKGQYGYVEKGGRATEIIGQLQSPSCAMQGSMCVELWAFLDGSHHVELNVYTSGQQMVGVYRTIPMTVTDKRRMWKRVQTTIYPPGYRYSVLFELKLKGRTADKGFVAIDDVIGYEGECQNKREYDAVPVRLVGGPTSAEGRVEVFYKGQWGSMCRDGFDHKVASIICKKLKHSGGRTKFLPDYGQGSSRILMDNVQCPSGANDLAECKHNGWGQHDCRADQYARVRCNEPEYFFDSNTVRLNGNYKITKTAIEGRVEVYTLGQWGTVCDDGWNDQDARAVCAAFGFTGKAKAIGGAAHGQGKGKVWLSKVECQPGAVDLLRCKHAGLGKNSCPHSRDASVRCEYKTLGHSQTCDFDNNCPDELIQSTDDDFDWSRTNAGYKGNGMAVNTFNKEVGVARLVSSAVEVVPRSGPQCLNFRYHASNSLAAPLSVYTKTGIHKKLVWWVTKFSVVNTWAEVSLLLKGHQYSVVFEANRGPNYQGTVTVDDIRIRDGYCTGKVIRPATSPATITTPRPGPTQGPATAATQSPSQVLLNCDFTSGDATCGGNFRQDTNDDFDWSTKGGSTPSGGTGPRGDHTTGSGRYIYIETSNPRRLGDKARLIAERVGSGSRCLTFFYHMHGDHINTLNVYINNKKIFAKTGRQGDRWIKAEMNVNGAGPLIFEGTRGRDYKGDISLDDIKLRSGSCGGQGPVTTRPTSSPGRGTVFACNFDAGLQSCRLTQGTRDQLQWTLKQGRTPSENTGPSKDHTSGSGSYIYLEATGKTRGDRARLLTDTLPTNADMCLRFWYHMKGVDMGTLKVKRAELGRSLSVERSIFSKSGHQGDTWKKADVSIPASSRSSRIIFEGIRGRDYRSDIAIDDVSVTRGPC